MTEVTRAVEDAIAALLQAEELEASDTGDESVDEDIESLWNQVDRLTELLGQYARTLTNILPILRASDQPQR
jgi:predicted RNA binding protein with dsRBD fold (UPF0201 family)